MKIAVGLYLLLSFALSLFAGEEYQFLQTKQLNSQVANVSSTMVKGRTETVVSKYTHTRIPTPGLRKTFTSTQTPVTPKSTATK